MKYIKSEREEYLKDRGAGHRTDNENREYLKILDIHIEEFESSGRFEIKKKAQEERRKCLEKIEVKELNN